MNEAIKIHNKLRNSGKGFAAVLQVADQRGGVNNKTVQKGDISLVSLPVIRCALTNTMWSSCHCPPKCPVSLTSMEVAFHFSPSSTKELPSGGGKGLQELKFQIKR